jgi:hypothetical protein
MHYFATLRISAAKVPIIINRFVRYQANPLSKSQSTTLVLVRNLKLVLLLRMFSITTLALNYLQALVKGIISKPGAMLRGFDGILVTLLNRDAPLNRAQQ